MVLVPLDASWNRIDRLKSMPLISADYGCRRNVPLDTKCIYRNGPNSVLVIRIWIRMLNSVKASFYFPVSSFIACNSFLYRLLWWWLNWLNRLRDSFDIRKYTSTHVEVPSYQLLLLLSSSYIIVIVNINIIIITTTVLRYRSISRDRSQQHALQHDTPSTEHSGLMSSQISIVVKLEMERNSMAKCKTLISSLC